MVCYYMLTVRKSTPYAATMPTQAERTESTRAALIAAGRALFAERGFAATSIEELAAASGMTRGALYHHFRDKRALFEAVFEDVERSVMVAVAKANDPAADAWTNLVASCNAFLDVCLERDVQQVVLMDGPSVLGWDTWREIEERYALGATAAALERAMHAGFIAPQPATPLAHLLLAAVNEAGLVIARAADVKAARAEVGGAFETFLSGLRKGA